MKVEVDFELYRVRCWGDRKLCAWFGHPAFEPSAFVPVFGPGDPRDQCTRCGLPDPSVPAPEPYTHSFSGSLGASPWIAPLSITHEEEA